MKRRPLLCAIGSVGLGAAAGCLDAGRAGPDATTTVEPSNPNDLVASGPGDYPHEIHVDNSLEHSITLTIAVARGKTRLYQQSHTVAAQTNEVVAGLTTTSLPTNDRSVTVTATDSEGQTDSVSVSVSSCLGQIVFYYRDDTELDATYAIC